MPALVKTKWLSGKDENMKDLQTDRKQKTCSQKSSLEFEWLLKLPDRTDT